MPAGPYGLSADPLNEIPLTRSTRSCRWAGALHATTLRRQVQATAQRLDDELGDERSGFITGCPAEWAELPRPDVGLDGGYVHSCTQRTRRDGWFEVIAGKAVRADGRSSCFGYVQTYDSKPKRRLFDVLAAQGMQANQQVTFLTDGGEGIRELPHYLNPKSTWPRSLPRFVPLSPPGRAGGNAFANRIDLCLVRGSEGDAVAVHHDSRRCHLRTAGGLGGFDQPEHLR